MTTIRGRPPSEATAGAGQSAVSVRLDAVTFMTTYLVILLAVPADRRVEVLGGAGAPAALFATLGLLWWGWQRVQSRRRLAFQPVKAALAFLTASILSAYVVSASMALPATERSVADMGVLRLAAIAGILLVAHDGVSSPRRFLVLMRRISVFGGLYATLGLLQFFTGQTFVNTWSIPGLGDGGWISVGERAGFIRAVSTAMHSLEAAVVLVMVLPIALTVAIYDRQRSGLIRWYPVAAILFLSVLSVTRSALLGTVVVIAVLFWTWPRAVRLWMAAAIGFGLIAVYAGIPGMAGTIIGMFTATDPSLVSRTDSYDTVAAFIHVSPLFGRGLGTFLPSYWILDNQYLLTVVETGIVGLVALLLLIAVACWAAVSMRRVWEPRDELMGAFGYALLASVLAGSLILAFFDAFSFPQACGMFFLTIGLCGAYLNLCRAEATPWPDAADVEQPRAGRQRWIAGVAALAVMAGLSTNVLATPPVYYAQVDVLFILPEAPDDSNSLLGDPGLTLYLAGVVEKQLNAESADSEALTTFAPLYGTGIRNGHWIHIPDVGGQWETSHDRPLIMIEVVGDSPAQVGEDLRRHAERTADLARSSQELMEIPAPLHIRTSASPAVPTASMIGMKKDRAAAGLALLTIIVVAAATRGGDRLLAGRSRRRTDDGPDGRTADAADPRVDRTEL